MSLKMFWSTMIMKFGLIAIVFASLLGGVGVFVVLYYGVLYGVFALFGDNQAIRFGFVCFILAGVLTVCLSFLSGSLRLGFVFVAFFYLVCFMAFGAMDWFGVFMRYIENGLTVSADIPSPWPLMETNRGVWWSVRLFFGMVSVGCAAAGLAFFIKLTVERVVKPMLEGIKTLNSEVQKNAQNVVERQKLRSKYQSLPQVKPESDAL